MEDDRLEPGRALKLERSRRRSDRAAGVENGRSYEILLVEDHHTLADVTREMLERAGQRVTLARSGAEAVRLADARRPELVLCDLRLPDMHGAQVAKRLRRLCGDEVVLVAVSADEAEAIDLHDGLFAFACDKPLDWNALAARLTTLGR